MPRLGDTLLKHLIIKETDHPESDIECAALTGSEKQISWATDIRASRMLVAKSGRALFGALLASREQSEEFMICLQSIRRAHWWIETRTMGFALFVLAALDEGLKARYVTPPNRAPQHGPRHTPGGTFRRAGDGSEKAQLDK